jgi:hypothetical protein
LTKIDYFLQGAELPAERVPGLLIKARALFGLGQYAAAADLLAERQALADKTMWAGDFAYWRARALFKIGRSAEALPLLEGFETRYPVQPLPDDRRAVAGPPACGKQGIRGGPGGNGRVREAVSQVA